MNFNHIIIVRFSVRLCTGFQKQGTYDYLFNDGRMSKRLEYFEKFCYYSLAKQSADNFKVVIIIDPQIPPRYIIKLCQIIDNHPQFVIHVWNPETDNIYDTKWLEPYIDKRMLYTITTRLDDDDALHKDFVKIVQHEAMKRQIKVRKGINMAISLYTGDFVLLSSDGQLAIKQKKVRCCGAGLTLITKTGSDKYVYSYDHSRIYKEVPCKYVNIYPHAFMVLNHDQNDSKRFRDETGSNGSYQKTSLERVYETMGFE